MTDRHYDIAGGIAGRARENFGLWSMRPNSCAKIVLYDGFCPLCNFAVRMILRWDRNSRFCFASLLSDYGRRLASQHRVAGSAPDSVVLLENGRGYTRSEAVLRICRDLALPWSLLYPARWLPSAIVDRIYSTIAARRYGWFGRHDACPVPPARFSSRFLG